MSDASFATAVPSPIDNPTSATFNAGASLVPSPVAATTSPFALSNLTKRSLSLGRARESIFMSSARDNISSSLIAANSLPVTIFLSVSELFQSPICLPISLAVPVVSPVTIFTCIPASIQFFIAAGTSLRTGSEIANTPTNDRFAIFNFPSLMISSSPLTSAYANPSVRIALFWYSNNSSLYFFFCSSFTFDTDNNISGAPFTYTTFLFNTAESTTVAIYLFSVENGRRSMTLTFSRMEA